MAKLDRRGNLRSRETQKLIMARIRKETTMDALNKINDFGEQDVSSLLNGIIRIYYMTYEKQPDDLKILCSLMIKKGLLEIFVRIWDFCHENTEELYSNTESVKFANLKRIKVIFWNYSDKCVEIAKACSENADVIERLMREFTIAELDVERLQELQIRLMMEATLGVLHNLLRHEGRNRNHIRKHNGIDKILAYEKSVYLIIKAKIFIVLAYCINEDENTKIMTGRGVVEFVIELLSSALERKDHVAEKYMFSAEETTAALNKLASNDENKKTIVEAGILPLLVKLLQLETSTQSERLEAVNCIWSLAFHPENKEKILEEPGLVDGITKLRSEFGSDYRMNRSCSSVMFVLGLEISTGGNFDKEKLATKHIMLSYNWEVQPVILQMRDFLQLKGFKVWIDVDNVHDSLLSAMAEAIENAAVVIIAMTESYKNSNSCRTEAEYAYKRKVPILPLRLQKGYVADGWLGALMGTKLYVDLTRPSLQAKFSEVKRQVEALISSYPKNEGKVVPGLSTGNSKAVNGDTHSVIMPNQVDRMTTSGGGPSLARTVIPCRRWTCGEVNEWCQGIGLQDNSAMNEFDGVVLSQLCKLLLRSPDTYYLILRQDIKLSFRDMLTFTDALETLLSSLY